MHIYAFGSVCRGEIDRGSDVDLLACVDGPAPQIDPGKYSVYSYERLRALWSEGNPFAWHLHLESKLLFSSDGSDFLADLGRPEPYISVVSDCEKFKKLFDRSYQELENCSNSAVFNLSCMFLAVRNFATCHSLSIGQPIFSRNSPLMVNPSLPLGAEAFFVLTRARLLSTRGYGEGITPDEISATINAASAIPHWMAALRSQK
ncbi:nucleotidyltransferase domain-containing protein [Cupriavidus taiwanensis]|uniref:nucleotidyltransferase domain-containing protein n=1 Tax=Cupriavidus taiwanensis TaxID=164546 RepID=UPI000E1FC125|nr:nucleotidyltransferase domain-containing protein [Cupriavidus taiwanensis]